MTVTAEEKAALAETHGVLDRDQAIVWCVENLAHWPRLGMGSSCAEPNGWEWVVDSAHGLHLCRYGYHNIVKDTYASALGLEPVIMTDEKFTGHSVASEKVEALALRLFEQRLKETIGGTSEVAKWAVEGANTFYQALGSDE